MFKEVFSEYIKSNMDERGWKLKDMARESTLSDSTINSYILMKINNPSEDNMLLIVHAFGHSPDTIAKLRQQASLTAKGVEKSLVNAADDKQRMELFVKAVKETVSQTLEEYRIQSAAQQTEIIQHADQRVLEAKAETKEKCLEIAAQCREHEREFKEHHNAILAAELRVVAAEKKGLEESIRRLEKNIVYLRTIVRNVSIVTALLGAYSLYAFKVFDINDPSQGLYQGVGSTNLPLIVMLVVALFAALSVGKGVIGKKISNSVTSDSQE